MNQQANATAREMPDTDFCKNVKRFRSTADNMESRMIELRYLLLVARFAALWEKEHVTFSCDEEDYCCWSIFLEGPIASAVASLTVSVSDFNNAALDLMDYSEKIPDLIDSFKKAADSINGLVYMFSIVAVHEDESGRDENNAWAFAFKSLLSAMENFKEQHDSMWNEVVKPLVEMSESSESQAVSAVCTCRGR